MVTRDSRYFLVIKARISPRNKSYQVLSTCECINQDSSGQNSSAIMFHTPKRGIRGKLRGNWKGIDSYITPILTHLEIIGRNSGCTRKSSVRLWAVQTLLMGKLKSFWIKFIHVWIPRFLKSHKDARVCPIAHLSNLWFNFSKHLEVSCCDTHSRLVTKQLRETTDPSVFYP